MSKCLFCQIVHGDISVVKLYESDTVVAFKDIKPQAPIHILVIPKKHIDNILGFSKEDTALLADVMKCVQELVNELDVAEDGFRLVVNTGCDGGQTVHHVHFHVLGGRRMSWPPG